MPLYLNAQITGMPMQNSTKSFGLEMEAGKSMEGLLNTEMMPAGNKINPDYYYLGPNDVLSIQVFPMMFVPQFLSVSPSISVILPHHGMLEIGKMTLTELKDTLNTIYRKINNASEVSLVLQKPRTCLIKFSGNIKNYPTYTMPSTYRISTALNYIDNIESSNQIHYDKSLALLYYDEKLKERAEIYSESGLPSETMYVNRNIKVLHSDGTATNVDLEKASYLQEFKYDPYIREGDVIVLPFEKEDFPSISISGAVTRPVKMSYKPGDRVSLLLKAAYGLNDNADKSDILLHRPGKETVRLEVDEEMNLLSEDFELSSGAKIVVGELEPPKITNSGVVSVKGMVNKPGVYVIEEGITKLKDIIDEAGGLTDEAYLPLSTIYRRSKIDLSTNNPVKKIDEIFQYSDLRLLDTLRYKIDVRYMNSNVSVNFEKLYGEGSERHNVYLKDGDVIDIPSSPGQVYIFGQVVNPGYIAFHPGKKLEWYVDKAGGMGENADKSRARIIRGKNKVWIESEKNVYVYAGDMIYIPREIDLPPDLETQRYGALAAVVGSIVAVVNLIIFLVSTRNK